MSKDLTDRLRESVRACRAIDRSQLLEEAADEIERLRNNASAYTDGISAGCKSQTLTDAEREAVEAGMRSLLDDPYDGAPISPHVATLRALLERLK